VFLFDVYLSPNNENANIYYTKCFYCFSKYSPARFIHFWRLLHKHISLDLARLRRAMILTLWRSYKRPLKHRDCVFFVICGINFPSLVKNERICANQKVNSKNIFLKYRKNIFVPKKKIIKQKRFTVHEPSYLNW